MASKRKPYRGIPENMRRELKTELGRLSDGDFVFKYREVPGSDFERLYDSGILWKESTSDEGIVNYGLTEEARKDLGVTEFTDIEDIDATSDVVELEWSRKIKPETLPSFSYKTKNPHVTLASESDRQDFMRTFIDRLGDAEFTRRDFEDFSGRAGYIRSDSDRLLESLYDIGIVERIEIVHGENKYYSYRIPEDVKDLAKFT